LKIQCQNCGVEHEIDPPSWVVSSGRAFRFRCSSCGFSQSVQPTDDSPSEPEAEPPPVTVPQPSFPPSSATPPSAPRLPSLPDPEPAPPAAAYSAGPEPRAPAPPPVAPQVAGVDGVDPQDAPAPRVSTEQPVNRLARPTPSEDDAAYTEPDDAAEPEQPARRRGSSGPTILPFEDSVSTEPISISHLSEPDAGNDAPTNTGNAVFLKQNGQIYMVSDWDTLKRWIAESRVDRQDLVSEGGVRWEPIGSRPDLLSSFAPDDGLSFTDGSPGNTLQTANGLLGGETPFGADYQSSSGWHDDDTEGIPTGLPPLPTDEVPHPASTGPSGFDAVNIRRHMTPTPPPVGRRRPPPVQRPTFVPPPPPDGVAARMGLEQPGRQADPSPPELPPDAIDTARPHPLRDNPAVSPTVDPDAQATAPGSTMRTTHAAPPLYDPVEHTPGSSDPSIAPPALPDTVPPPPVRAGPQGPSAPAVVRELEREATLETEVVERAPVSEHDMEIDFYQQNTDEILAATRRSNGPLMFAGCFVLLAIAAVGLILVVTGYPGGFGQPETPDPAPTDVPDPQPLPDPQPVEPEPEPDTQPEPAEPDPEPDTQPEPLPDAAPEPAPQPVAEPQPVPGPIQPTPTPGPLPVPGPRPSSSVQQLITQGWQTADSDPADAISMFEQALSKDPDNVDAHYGYGYALLKSGNANLAKRHLCIARDRGDRDTTREARGMLTNNGLVCE
jgi:hypothetical protein